MEKFVKNYFDHNAYYRTFAERSYEERINPPYPVKYLVEVSNYCNLACGYCALKDKKSGANMPLEAYQDFMEFLRDNELAARVTLNANGEPLMHPQILDFVNTPTSENIVLAMISNGSLLTEKQETIPGLVDSNLNFIQFSIDSCRKAEYDAHRPTRTGKSVYGKVMRGVLSLIIENERKGRPVYVSVTVMQNPDVDIDAQRAFWEPLVDNVNTPEINNFGANLDEKGRKRDGGRPVCKDPWEYMYLSATGKVKACCLDVHDNYAVGDFQETPLENIWNGERMQAIRAGLMDESLLRSMDLGGLNCVGCDSPYVNCGDVQTFHENTYKMLGREMAWKARRGLGLEPSMKRIALAQELIAKLDVDGDISL